MREARMTACVALAAVLAGTSCGVAQTTTQSVPEKKAPAPQVILWKADPNAGDWQGKKKDGSAVVAQVIAYGGGKYTAKLLPGFDQRVDALATFEGNEKDGKITFSGADGSAVIEAGRFTGECKKGEPFGFELQKTERLSPTLGAKAPAGATVLFDGTNLDAWQKVGGGPLGWKVVDGIMQVVPKTGSVESKKAFGDCKMHIEFRSPFMPFETGQKRGNSGVYVQGAYEIQVLDSYGLEGVDNECGGIYKVGKPLVNMCAPPLQWQTYDITFKAARFNEKGEKTANARINVDHNGVTIHKDLELPAPTAGGKQADDPKVPAVLMLQEHHDQVQFRNIWVEDLTQK